jgi:hypothetical protein
MKRVWGCLAVVVILGGCASRFAWVKENTSAYQANNEISECRYQVGLHKTSPDERDQLIVDCMQSKGFRWRRAS